MISVIFKSIMKRKKGEIRKAFLKWSISFGNNGEMISLGFQKMNIQKKYM